MPNFSSQRFSIAPMLDWTDRHCRYFHRQLTGDTLLYTEMVTTGAIIHGKGDYLAYSEAEHPVALQLGGSDPAALAQCAKLAEQRGYDEVNLNVGCPSDRVQNGRFGACLMAEANLVADAVKAMRDVVSIPVTVKTRIGIDELDSYEFLTDFIGTVAGRGECETFIIHARKAWLSGLSPKENREIPPLDYPRVYQLKRDFPQLTIALNGGVKTLEEAQTHLQHLDGVMMDVKPTKIPAFWRRSIRHCLVVSIRRLTRLKWCAPCIPILKQNWRRGRIWDMSRAICWVCSRGFRAPASGDAT